MNNDDETTITKRTGQSERAPGELQPCLLVLTGSSVGRSFRLTSTSTVIGRGAEADIRLDDDGISRHHAKVVLLPNGVVVIKDLDSTHRRYLNRPGRPPISGFGFVFAALRCSSTHVRSAPVLAKASPKPELDGRARA